MDTNMFCVLCGGPFDLEQGVIGIDPEKTTFQWLYNVRMLGTPSALRSHRMTTAGEIHLNLSDDPVVFLSETVRWTATDADCVRLGDSFYNVLIDDADGDVVFPLHDACIQIGCRAQRSCDPNQARQHGSSVLARLYYILRRQYQYAKEIGHEPDVLALRGYSKVFGPRSTLALDELGWWSGAYERYLSDPLDVPNLTFAAFSLLQPLVARKAGPVNTAPGHLPRGIEGLPCEILERITESLSPLSIMTLRQVSRSLALKVSLDDRFWRRHLCSGSLLPYLWDLDEELLKRLLQRTPTEVSRDWRSLARAFRSEECLRRGQDPLTGEIPSGLWNRCRIWSIVEEANVPPNTKPQSHIVTPSRHLNHQRPKSDIARALSFSMVAVLIVIVVSRDIKCLGLPSALSYAICNLS